MAKKRKTPKPPATRGLRLNRHNGNWIDQYGRVLEEFVNKQGQRDLRPVGVGYARH
jgi:hypothetical protein